MKWPCPPGLRPGDFFRGENWKKWACRSRVFTRPRSEKPVLSCVAPGGYLTEVLSHGKSEGQRGNGGGPVPGPGIPESVEDCRALLEDLCTRKEVEQMAQRIRAARLLKEGQDLPAGHCGNGYFLGYPQPGLPVPAIRQRVPEAAVNRRPTGAENSFPLGKGYFHLAG